MAAKSSVLVDEDNSKLPTLYWLPKLSKIHYQSVFITNSSSCTTTELFVRLTSCLTAKKYVIKYILKPFMRGMVTLYFGLLKFR